ncbi:hypothetical protein PHMEG_00029729 [Phytophthora megakarya]|uniref:Uncharacterized protein n=1 Tax=Phytophthora megakarya TaxID=4795 RepID=A0A225V1P6_9STRA|nr:hypothetical protein PHMEG_00029729 [Phytophthora megakarya]
MLNSPSNKTTLSTPSTKATANSPTVYAHVNRILDRVAPGAEVTKALSSHSFRRRGAQHANGCEELTERWIFGRGSRNMSTTKMGYKPNETVALQDLSRFDSQTLTRIETVQQIVFASCYNLATNGLNIVRQLIHVLIASVLCHFPHLNALNTSSPAVSRIAKAVTSSGGTIVDLMSWASHLVLPADICEINKCPD